MNISRSITTLTQGQIFRFENRIARYRVIEIKAYKYITYQNVVTKKKYTIFDDSEQQPWGLSRLERTKVKLIKK